MAVGTATYYKRPRANYPKLSMQQITPPVVVVRNEHPKLAVEPTIIVPPQVQLASNNTPNFGDPMSHAVLPSNGTGSGGGSVRQWRRCWIRQRSWLWPW